jgi:hypothetical protein
MAGALQLSKTSDVLSASCNCVGATAGHYTFQMIIQQVSKAREYLEMVHTEKSGRPKLPPQIFKVGEIAGWGAWLAHCNL